MNPSDASAAASPIAPPQTPESSPLGAPLAAGLLSWAAISLGFFGLKMLMLERPEFVGQPMRVTMAELVQESPQIFTRRMSDDVSVIRYSQPEFSDVRFDMKGRRDYRGLRTIMDMSGQVRTSFVLTNALEEPIFILFNCPHPRGRNENGGMVLASELRLQSPASGVQENTTNAWLWSGTLEARSSATMDISYHVTALKGLTYRVGDQSGNQVKQLRVTLRQQDVPAMRVESGDGAKRVSEETVTWERKDFLAPDFFSAHIGESRNLHTSLIRLLEIGPLICLLFLLTTSAMILVRQKLTALQMLTIAAGYSFYFPLIVYLSANFSFKVALVIAFAVPGALLVNYARWLTGSIPGLVAGLALLLLYQVFPTLAAFAGWHRGMVLLCLGIVTLAVLINLQNRALKRRTAAAVAALVLLLPVLNVSGAELQLTLPAELITKLSEPKREVTNSLVAFDPAQYQVRQEAGHFRIEARIPFQVLRPSETAIPLFGAPVHLQEVQMEPPHSEVARLVVVSNQLSLYVPRSGAANLRLVYRAPIVSHEGRRRVSIPVALGPSGNVRLESVRGDLEILNGNLWGTIAGEKSTVYDIGVAGVDSLVVEWRDSGGEPGLATARQAGTSREFYGIGLTHARNLTLINSDGSCTHFAEFDVPATQAQEFEIKLPPKARMISVSVNGAEVTSPTVEDQLCRLRLPAREAQQILHRLSFRIAYPPVKLGFVGTAELSLPEVFQTAGTLEWVVAVPGGFETQVVSSGLEPQRTAPDLGRFGDYGRILKSQSHTYLAKTLAPPGPVRLSLKYRQLIP